MSDSPRRSNGSLDRLMTKEELAARLGVAPTWVEKRVTAREIPFTKIGRLLRFTEEHYREIVAAGEERPVKTNVRTISPSPRRRGRNAA